MIRKGFTLIELVVVFVIVGLILTLGFVEYTKWSKKNSVERDTRLIYTLISKERMIALSEGKSFKVTANGNTLTVKDLDTNREETVNLNNPYSGTISIYSKGLMSRGSIVFRGDLNLHPDVSCVISDGLRLRMGQTYVDSRGRRKCR